ncbi:MAG: PAS domain-containing protein, partial [Deltaproteobacteria bacterium]|nr:PAS domain-containing protein [Deltaproteobacteria bacterium]
MAPLDETQVATKVRVARLAKAALPYFYALVIVGIGLFIRQMLLPFFGQPSPALLYVFSACIFVTGLYHGLGAGLFATLVTALVIDSYLMPPTGWRWVGRPDQHMNVVVFALVGIVTTFVTARLRGIGIEREAAERRLRLALSAGNSYAFEWNSATDRVWSSSERESILGLPGSGYDAGTALEHMARVHSDDRTQVRAVLDALTPKSPTYKVQYRFTKPDQSEVVLEENGRAQFDPNGKIVRIRGVASDVSSRSKLEDEFRRASALLRALSENSTDLLYAKDLQSRVLFANPATLRALGKTEDEVLGHSEMEIHDFSEQGKAVRASDLTVLEAGEAREFEEVLTTKKFSRVYHSVKAPMRDQNGAVTGLFGISRDVTEKKYHELERENERQSLQVALEAAEAGTWSWNFATNFACDTRYMNIYGFQPGSRISYEDWVLRLHPNDRDAIVTQRHAFLEHKDVWDEQYRIIHPTKGIRWISSRARGRRGPGGASILAFGVDFDITAKKTAEFAIRESEERLRLAAESAQFGTFDFDLETNELFLSPELLSILGLTLSPMLWPRVDEAPIYVHPEDRSRFTAKLKRALEPGCDGIFEHEHRVLLADQSVRWIQTRGRVSFHMEGGQPSKPIRFTGVQLDITERRRSEDERLALLEAERAARSEAEKASRLKDEFVAMLSHELRTPIHSILGWSQLLRKGFASPDDVKQGLDIIERNCKLQAQLISDLLDINRMASGKLRLELGVVDLADAVQNVVETYRPSAEAKHLVYTYEADEGACHVSGDFSRLQQIGSNILGNAIKFTPDGGSVSVHLTRAG